MDSIVYHFEAKGCHVDIYSNGQAALFGARQSEPDLLITNWMLPGMTGIEVTAAVRADPNLNSLPIYVLGYGEDSISKLRALDAGANAYFQGRNMLNKLVQKFEADFDPFPQSPRARPLSGAGIVIEPLTRTVFFQGQPVRLSPTEYDILYLLVSRPEKVFSRRNIIDLVWGQDAAIDSRTVDVQIGRLRRALKMGDRLDPIKTVHGKGYRLTY